MDFLALIAVAAAVVWGGVVAARGGLLATCAVVLLAGVVLSTPLWSLPTKPVPLTIDRLLWLAMLVHYAIARRMGLIEPRRLGRVDFALLALLAVLAFSTLSHDWSAHNNQPVARMLFLWIMPAGLYFVAREARLTEQGLRNVSISFGLFALYLAVTAFAETREAWWAVFPRYIGSPETKEFLGRGRGPLLNPAGNGLYIATGMAAWLLLWLKPPEEGRTFASARFGKLIVAGLIAVCLLGVYSTLTRSVWMGAGLCVCIVLGLGVPKAWRMPVLGGGLVLASVLLVSQWDSILSFKRDKQLSAKETAESVKLRPILARVAWNMFLDRPLLGCGYAQYLDQSIYYLHDRSTTLTLETARPYVQHNVLLSLVTETGLVGVGLFILVLASWTLTAWRLRQGDGLPPWVRRQGLWFLAILGAYVPNAMFQDMSLIPMCNALLFFMGGIITGLDSYCKKRVLPERTTS